MSIVIRSPAVIAVVVRVGAVAAVLVLTSAESIESLLVVIIVVPFLFTSHTDAHVVPAVSTYAPISVIVPVNGHSKAPAIFVPTALSVAFSIALISKYRTFLLEATYWSTGIARVESVPVFISAVVASSTIPACDVELVILAVMILFPSIARTPPDTLVIVLSVACHTFTPVNCGLSLVQSPIRAGIAVTLSSSTAPVPAVLRPRIRLVFMSTSHASGKSIQFVRVQEAGVPRAGVTRVGLLANTRAPEPVSSDIVFLSCREVVDAN